MGAGWVVRRCEAGGSADGTGAAVAAGGGGTLGASFDRSPAVVVSAGVGCTADTLAKKSVTGTEARGRP